MSVSFMLRCVLALAWAFVWIAAEAQIVYGAGTGFYYGVPLGGSSWSWPYAGLGAWYPNAYRLPGIAPSCLRVGRCAVSEMEYYYRQPHIFERRAPAAPEASSYGSQPVYVFGPDVGPTPDEAVRPEYRGASRPREAYSESGRPLLER